MRLGRLGTALVTVAMALREPRPAAVPFAHGVLRFPGSAVTGDENRAGWQWPFYPIGSEAPSRPLPPGMGFEPRRGAILNFGAFLIRHTIVQRNDYDPYNFDARPVRRADHAAVTRLFDAADPHEVAAFDQHVRRGERDAGARVSGGFGNGESLGGLLPQLLQR